MIRTQVEQREREENEKWLENSDIYTAIYMDIEKGRQMHFFFRASVKPEERAREILAEKGINNYTRLKIKEDNNA